MNQKLLIESDITLEELEDKVANGYKFIVFQYCVSILFAITLRRFSPAILIKNNDEIREHKKRYNRYSLLFGLWAIPWGIIHTINSLKINNTGGVDVTEDIMVNITKEGLQNREIELKITTKLFLEPEKSDLKAFNKALLKGFERDYNVKQIAVGLFVNVDEGEAPFYMVGIKVEKDFEKYNERLDKALYKYFRKHVYFEYVDLNENEDVYRRLEKQGSIILNKTHSNNMQ